MKTFAQTCLMVLGALVGGGLCVWAVHDSDVREIDRLAKDALCVLELQGGKPECSASFTTSQTVDRFQVGARLTKSGERLWLSISGTRAPIFSGPVARPVRFACGREIPPGTYWVTLRQDCREQRRTGRCRRSRAAGTHHAMADHVADIHADAGPLGALGGGCSEVQESQAPCGECLHVPDAAARLPGDVPVPPLPRGRALRGRDALRRSDLAASDFWGIHGHPHAGVTSGPGLKAWQQAIITGGGVMAPTFAGWALFLVWISRTGQRLIRGRPMANLYVLAIVAMLIFPSVVVAGCLLGILDDTETRSFIANTPGPAWLVHVALCSILLVNAAVMGRVAPELWKAWRTLAGDLPNESEQ